MNPETIENSGKNGLFLDLEECKCLFHRLKKEESSLPDGERLILLRIEKMLYAMLSISEIEELLD